MGLWVALLLLSQAESPYARWGNGPPRDPSFFPIAVWAQQPAVEAEVLGEDRVVPIRDGALTDRFGSYGIRLYRLR